MAIGPTVLDFASDEPLARPILDALYHAAPATDQQPDLRYRVERDGGGWIGIAPRRPRFGPARLEEVFAFLEWRATEDLLAAPGALYLHAAGIQIGARNVLIVGVSGAGKSSLAAHLLARGYLAWGDDLVRFALRERCFSAVPRSWKLDPNTLASIYLLSLLTTESAQGTILAPSSAYASPAAIRRKWQAPDAPADVVVRLDPAGHHGPPRLQRTSEGAAAVETTQLLIGGLAGRSQEERTATMGAVLEAMSGLTAYRACGGPPGALADVLERELAA